MKRVRARLRKTPIGLAIVVGFFVLGLIGPWVAPYDPLAIDLLHEYEPPSWTHLLGTGDNGIDILSALLHGARLAASLESSSSGCPSCWAPWSVPGRVTRDGSPTM